MVNSSKKTKKVSKKTGKSSGKISKNSVAQKSSNSKLKVKKSYFFGLLFLVIILFSVIVFSPNKPPEEDVYRFYRGYEFVKSDLHQDLWTTIVKFEDSELKMEFWHHPLDLESIPYDTDVNQYLFLSQNSDGRAYISWSEDVLAEDNQELGRLGSDLARILRSFFGFEIVVSAENVEGRPWVTCEDANIDNFVFLIKKGDMRVEAEPFCAILYVDDVNKANLVSSVVIYHLFGILE